jgi:pimeloyl-ACP methyl ester carboxylesterase
MNKFWHKLLRRPYKLSKAFDVGAGTPVVMLHGIGRTGQVWQHVMELLAPLPLRVIAFDLLGFGGSPKPEWAKYDIDDHARAVIASIKRERFGQPAVLVGHSMGSLVAVRIARLRPDLVRHLVLYEMPLYEGLPEKRIYRLRTDLYFRFYRRVMKFQPVFNEENARLADRLAQRVAGLEVTPETWTPFIRSLENTIMKQTTAQDIKKLDIAADVIYGSFDMLVIRGKPQLFFGKGTKFMAHTIRARHVISVKASRFIVERIEVALAVPDVDPVLG